MQKTIHPASGEPSRTATTDAAFRDSGVVLVYTTFPAPGDAKKAAHEIVRKRLAACANIFPGMTSVYFWEGKVEEGGETAMILKTARTSSEALLAEIRRLHPYSTPALLTLPVTGGGEDFLEWIVGQCGAGEVAKDE